MFKATFANGVDFYFDENVHAVPTHYGDGKAQHPLTAIVKVADDEEARFEEPDGTRHPLADKSAAPAVEDKDARIARLEAELAAANQG